MYRSFGYTEPLYRNSVGWCHTNIFLLLLDRLWLSLCLKKNKHFSPKITAWGPENLHFFSLNHCIRTSDVEVLSFFLCASRSSSTFYDHFPPFHGLARIHFMAAIQNKRTNASFWLSPQFRGHTHTHTRLPWSWYTLPSSPLSFTFVFMHIFKLSSSLLFTYPYHLSLLLRTYTVIR